MAPLFGQHRLLVFVGICGLRRRSPKRAFCGALSKQPPTKTSQKQYDLLAQQLSAPFETLRIAPTPGCCLPDCFRSLALLQKRPNL